MTEPHLLPCPFCGSVQTDVAMASGFEGGDAQKPTIAAGCYSCGAVGPMVAIRQGSTGHVQAADAWNLRAAASGTGDPTNPANPWRPLTGPGQVRPRDWLCFTLGRQLICAPAQTIVNCGTAREEIIYNSRQNHYFITAMAVDGSSSHKGVLVADREQVARLQNTETAHD